MNSKLSGLYAITPTSITDTDLLLQKVTQALQGGARIIQYRDKSLDHVQRQHIASLLRERTHQHGALLLINDDVTLAAKVNADGVHLGQDDLGLRQAREQLGANAIIGISCYNRFELAQQAADQGADYIAFGRFFPSRTKPDAVQADLALLQRARQELRLPVVAIGGISADNGSELIQAGADMLAVVEAVFGQDNVKTAARELKNLFLTA